MFPLATHSQFRKQLFYTMALVLTWRGAYAIRWGNRRERRCMADRESEVPLDLQDAIENAIDGGVGLWLDIHPPTDWHDCPECGTRLYGESLFHTTDDILAVTYACTNDDCLARWVWETVANELHYRGEVEIVAIGERDNDE
jgi:hypothetical protein